MRKERELIKNTIIIALGKLSTQFISFLLLPLYTAYLSVAEFGVVDLVTVIAALVAPIILLSLEMGVFRFLIDERGDKTAQSRVVTNSLQMIVVSLLLAVALFVGVNYFFTVPYAWLALGVICVTVLSNYFLQVARGLGDTVKFSIASIVAGLSTVILNITFIVFLKMGASGMLLAVAIGNILSIIYLVISLKLYSYIDKSLTSHKQKKALLKYSLPLIPNSVSWWVINAADRLIITTILGIASNGIYAVAYKFPQIFSALYSFFGMSWAESASVHIKSKDRDVFFSKVANLSLRIFGSLGAIIIVGVSIFFGILINETYSEARIYIPLLIIGALFNSIVGVYSAIYIAQKRTKRVLYTSVAAAIISISLSAILTPFIGLYGPSLALVVSYATMAIARHRDIGKSITITYEASAIYSIAILYAITIVLYYINNPLLNVVNVLFIGSAVIYINKHTLGSAKNILLEKTTKLRKTYKIHAKKPTKN